MAEPNKQQIGDGADNYGSAVNNAAKAAKQAIMKGRLSLTAQATSFFICSF